MDAAMMKVSLIIDKAGGIMQKLAKRIVRRVVCNSCRCSSTVYADAISKGLYLFCPSMGTCSCVALRKERKEREWRVWRWNG